MERTASALASIDIFDAWTPTATPMAWTEPLHVAVEAPRFGEPSTAPARET